MIPESYKPKTKFMQLAIAEAKRAGDRGDRPRQKTVQKPKTILRQMLVARMATPTIGLAKLVGSDENHSTAFGSVRASHDLRGQTK